MTPLSFVEVLSRLDAWTFPEGIDGVVGIASGGIVPAALVAQRLRRELRTLAVRYRDDRNQPRYAEPRLLGPPPSLEGWKRVLLVDDVYVSGKTWHAARAVLPEGIEVIPFVLKGRVDFALIRDLDGCVQWPWRTP